VTGPGRAKSVPKASAIGLSSPVFRFTKLGATHPDVHSGEENAEERHHQQGKKIVHSKLLAQESVPKEPWLRSMGETNFVNE
jgi:hypothetical protein